MIPANIAKNLSALVIYIEEDAHRGFSMPSGRALAVRKARRG